jgi:hypothetical protein
MGLVYTHVHITYRHTAIVAIVTAVTAVTTLIRLISVTWNSDTFTPN